MRSTSEVRDALSYKQHYEVPGFKYACAHFYLCKNRIYCIIFGTGCKLQVAGFRSTFHYSPIHLSRLTSIVSFFPCFIYHGLKRISHSHQEIPG